MQPISLDLRKRVIAAVDAGKSSLEEIARQFSVSCSWVRRLVQRRRETGTIEPKPHGGGRPRKLDDEAHSRLKELVLQQRDSTLEELREGLGEPVGIMTIARALERLELPQKKSADTPPSSRVLTCNNSGSNISKRSRIWTPAA